MEQERQDKLREERQRTQDDVREIMSMVNAEGALRPDIRAVLARIFDENKSGDGSMHTADVLRYFSAIGVSLSSTGLVGCSITSKSQWWWRPRWNFNTVLGSEIPQELFAVLRAGVAGARKEQTV